MATSGVNVKMGVSGVAQFKQSMNQAKASVKTLDQALALNEKQFQATGDAQTYMQEKADLLQRKLEKQKDVIADAEKALKAMSDNGVDKASSAFQQMQQTLLKANADLLDTQMQLDGIGTSGQEAGDGVDEMNHQLQRIGDGVNYQNVTEGLGTITDGLGSVIRKAWQMGEALVQATLGAGSWADELMTTAAQYEITPEELQRMRKTANLIDTDVETILDAQDKLKKNREGGGKEFMGALAYLGINPRGKDDLTLFWEAGEAIKALGKNEDKVTYAQRIFGKSWRELLPLFTAGREEYEKTNASWNVVEQEQLDNLGKMDDAYQKLTGEWETFKMEMLSAFSGPLTEGMDAITGLFRELNNYLDTPEGQAMIAQIGETISSLITDLTQINPEEVVGGLKSVIDGITGALKWISKNKETVVAALEGILLGWGALKLTGGALEVMKLINGLKGLNGSNPTLPYTEPTTTPTAPTAPTTGGGGGATGTAVAGATLKTRLFSGLGTAAQTAAFLLPAALLVDGLVQDANMIEEFTERGEEALARTEEITKDFQNSDMFNLWDPLNEYLRTPGKTGSTKMDEFADHYMKWFNDELQDPMLDKLSEMLTDEDFDRITDAMSAWKSGEMIYSDADRINMLDSMDRMLTLVEQEMGIGSGKNGNSEMTEAANGLKTTVPSAVERAVRNGMRGISVTIDGDVLVGYVNNRQATDIGP